jgi:uncharacterized protein (DUF433 family)
MPLQVAAQPVPLVVGDDGVVRVRGTRVTLDTLVDAFRSGATAEEIAQQYPTVALGDVYAIVAFYLHHQAEVDTYIQEGQIEAERLRVQVEQRFPPNGIRNRLLVRRSHGQTNRDAALGG